MGRVTVGPEAMFVVSRQQKILSVKIHLVPLRWHMVFPLLDAELENCDARERLVYVFHRSLCWTRLSDQEYKF